MAWLSLGDVLTGILTWVSEVFANVSQVLSPGRVSLVDREKQCRRCLCLPTPSLVLTLALARLLQRLPWAQSLSSCWAPGRLDHDSSLAVVSVPVALNTLDFLSCRSAMKTSVWPWSDVPASTREKSMPQEIP